MRWFLSCLLLPALGVRAALDLHNLVNSVWVNWLLAVFNMLPQPRLDGGRGLYQI